MPRHAFNLLISRSTVFRSFVACGTAAPAALLLPVGGLVLLLGDDCLDAAFPQVRAASAGGIGLVRGDGAGPGSRPADRQTDPYLLQHGDELRAVGGLSCGQYE